MCTESMEWLLIKTMLSMGVESESSMGIWSGMMSPSLILHVMGNFGKVV
jgi:hypothetical protein